MKTMRLRLPAKELHGVGRAARKLAAWTALLSFSAVAQAPTDIRVALVIGNSAYAGRAALVNPVNDAAAMAAALKRLGFSVIELRDGSRAQMAEAIASVRATLRGKQGVGMLYYAGHGLQLDWHNYMVPVDARMATAADVPAQTVDIDSVIGAFKSAGNRMNILVLDACRDNPFAGTGGGKGLAQLDAPPGTFLAYATAPGNVAEDGGDGSNGLYTGYLVQELGRPAARIEDVFKRVRLQVRQRSGGRQIPWESTSLEEDFFFDDGVKFTSSPEELEKLAAQAKLKEQQLLQQAGQARERERQLAAALERERALQREREAQAARDAQAQRLAAEARAREAERLSAQAREQEQARLAAEARAQEAQRRDAEAQARERERQLALAQQEERARAEAAANALRVAQQAEQARLRVLAEAKAEAEAHAREKLSAEEAAERAYAREKADWDRIAESRNPADFYEFLKKYPSGKISEIANAALERLAAAQVIKAPNREGLVQASARDRFRLGDAYEFTVRDDLTGTLRPARSLVTRVNDETVELGDGRTVLTREGGLIRNPFIQKLDPPRLDLPSDDYAIGKKWTFRSLQTYRNGRQGWVEGVVRIVALEEVTVPAGTFKAYRVELTSIADSGERVKLTRWMQPDWGFPVKSLREIRGRSGAPTLETRELVSRRRRAG